MHRKLVAIGALASAITFGGIAGTSAPASATCSTVNQGGATMSPVAPDGSYVYAQGSGVGGSGDVGVTGPQGYLEAGSTTGTDAYVSGSATNAPLSGTVSTAPSACVSGVNG